MNTKGFENLEILAICSPKFLCLWYNAFLPWYFQVFGETKMVLTWREREHDIQDVIATNYPGIIQALTNCGLLKYFWILSMRAQTDMFQYLVRTWDVQGHHFRIGEHIVTINIEDIYFWIGLSWRGAHNSFYGYWRGEESMKYYVATYYEKSQPSSDRKIEIKEICDLHLRTILFTITHLASSTTPHLATKSQMQYALECLEPPIFF